jgi:hypothetical protein
MAVRRELRFDSLSEAIRDAETLLAKGYDKAGNWTLSQVCDHLSDWLTYPIDGFPKAPFFIAPVLWLIKVTVGKRKIAGYLQDRSFPAGKPTMPQTIHPPRDDKAAAERFRAAAERFVKHDGPVHPSPIFGAMTKDVAEQLQRVHCAHHLSFLVPKA